MAVDIKIRPQGATGAVMANMDFLQSDLVSSRFGVVILSQAFFSKNWPQYELDGLGSREMGSGKQLILPIWHNITKDELLRHVPSLVDKVALRTADLTVVEIGHRIRDAIRE